MTAKNILDDEYMYSGVIIIIVVVIRGPCVVKWHSSRAGYGAVPSQPT